MFKRLLKTPQKRRRGEIVKLLTEIAVTPIAKPAFENQNAFTRSYAVALGLVIPTYTVAAAFPQDVFPRWEVTVYKKSDQVFINLASILAWRACLAAFSDLDKIFEPERIEAARHSLMGIAGTVLPTSERADQLMRRYDQLERDVSARRELFDAGYVLNESYLAHVGHLEIHAWMVNETLDEAPLSHYLDDPINVIALQMYLANLEIEFVPAFKEKALELVGKHLAAGRP